MIEVDAFLADSVVAVEGKLYAHGAGWSILRTPQLPTRHPRIGIGLIFHVPYTDTDVPHHFSVRLDDADGGPVALGDGVHAITGELTVGRPDLLPPGDDQTVVFAVNVDGLVFTKADAYNFVIEVDGHEAKRLQMRVMVPRP